MERVDHISPTDWMRDPRTQTVVSALTAHGKPARFVGGCVRDTLIDRPFTDIDLATPEKPEDVIQLLKAANIKSIPTGLDHGTVMAVHEGKVFEITTLRKDIETYGRKASVAFTDDWVEDAKRRDFTMNALYLDADGSLYDPCDGVQDLKNGVVRFIGDPGKRIQEDYLRILRFFRFLATHGKAPAEDNDLRACQQYADQIPTLSRERKLIEMEKLLSAPDPTESLKLMNLYGVTKHTLSHIPETAALKDLIKAETTKDIAPSFLRRLACVFELNAKALDSIATDLRMSNAARKTLKKMCDRFAQFPALDGVYASSKILHDDGRIIFIDLVLISAALGRETNLEKAWNLAEKWTGKHFPLTGKSLINLGISEGPSLGKNLEHVKDWWLKNGGEPSKNQCLEWLARNKL